MNTPTKTQTWNERYRKNKAHIGAYIDKGLKHEMDKVAAAHRVTLTDIMVAALKSYLMIK